MFLRKLVSLGLALLSLLIFVQFAPLQTEAHNRNSPNYSAAPIIQNTAKVRLEYTLDRVLLINEGTSSVDYSDLQFRGDIAGDFEATQWTLNFGSELAPGDCVQLVTDLSAFKQSDCNLAGWIRYLETEHFWSAFSGNASFSALYNNEIITQCEVVIDSEATCELELLNTQVSSEASDSEPISNVELPRITVDNTDKIRLAKRIAGDGYLNSADWSPDGTYIAIGTSHGAWIYTNRLEQHLILTQEPIMVQQVIWSPGGSQIATVIGNTSDETYIEIWDVTTGTSIKQIDLTQYHSNNDFTTPLKIQNKISWSPNQRYLAISTSVSDTRVEYPDENLIMYDLVEDTTREIINENIERLSHIEWNKDGTKLLMHITNTNESAKLVIFGFPEEDTIPGWTVYEGNKILYGTAQWLDDTNLIAALIDETDHEAEDASPNQWVGVWDSETRNLQSHIDLDERFSYRKMKFSSDHTIFALLSRSGELNIFRTNGEYIYETDLPDVGFVHNFSLDWTPDGKTLIVNILDQAPHLYLYTAENNMISVQVKLDENLRSNNMFINSDSNQVLVTEETSGSLKVRIYHLDKLNFEYEKVLATYGNGQAVWSPDGSQFVAVSWLDPVVRVWDASSESVVREFRPRENGIYPKSVDWSGDGKYIAAGFGNSGNYWLGKPAVVYVWDVETGEIVKRIPLSQAPTPDNYLVPIQTNVTAVDVLALGLSEDFSAYLPLLEGQYFENEAYQFLDNPTIIVSESLTQDTDLGIGDKITLTIDNTSVEFLISGIFTNQAIQQTQELLPQELSNFADNPYVIGMPFISLVNLDGLVFANRPNVYSIPIATRFTSDNFGIATVLTSNETGRSSVWFQGLTGPDNPQVVRIEGAPRSSLSPMDWVDENTIQYVYTDLESREPIVAQISSLFPSEEYSLSTSERIWGLDANGSGYVAITTSQSFIILDDQGNQILRQPLETSDTDIIGLAWHPTDNLIAISRPSPNHSYVIDIWRINLNTAEAILLTTLSGHHTSITNQGSQSSFSMSLDWTDDGTRILSSGTYDGILIWEIPMSDFATSSAEDTASSETSEVTFLISEAEAIFEIENDLRGEHITTVGSTNQVTGDITLNFTNPMQSSASTFRIDARTIETDSAFLDRALRSEILESNRDEYQFIIFEPTAIIKFPENVAVREPIDFEMVGNLTIKDTTRGQRWVVSAELRSEDDLRVSAATEITYSDYGIEIPSVPGVANVSDKATLYIHFRARAVERDVASNELEDTDSVVATFGDNIILHEAIVDAKLSEIDTTLMVELTWSTDSNLNVSYSVGVHLLNQDGQLVSQHDGIPSNGNTPTNTWEVGVKTPDIHQLPIPDDLDLSSGNYTIGIVMYDYVTFSRLAVTTPDGIISDSYLLPLEIAISTSSATPSPYQRAQQGVTSNTEWEPYIETFDGVEMVLVPAGSFALGSSEEEKQIALELCNAEADENSTCPPEFFYFEGIQHTQAFTTPFWVDRTEVTRAMYQTCVDMGECESMPDSNFSIEDNQPITSVSWFEAKLYCEWRNARLPTEAEWEYAARGPDGLLFPWGNEFIGDRANHCDSNCGEADWSDSYNYINEENDDGFTVEAPVGSYPQGAAWVGTLDMAGNVSEWTSTIFRDYPYSEIDGREDLEQPNRRVSRGGAYNGSSSFLRTANRAAYDPDTKSSNFGFRCARDFDGKSQTTTESATEVSNANESAVSVNTNTPTLSANPLELAQQGVTSNAEWKPYSETINGSEMVLVPAGCFMMGSEDGIDEQPMHEICFDEPYWIDKYEVTIAQNDSTAGCLAPPTDQQAMVCASWFVAKSHCEDRGARLPNESEWEYAARGPDGLVYPWGNQWIPDHLNWEGTSLDDNILEVGSFSEGISWVGAMDMSGNAAEWVSTIYRIVRVNEDRDGYSIDIFYEYPYVSNDGREDLDNVEAYRILRGGSFMSTVDEVQGSTRYGTNPNLGTYAGIRCAFSN